MSHPIPGRLPLGVYPPSTHLHDLLECRKWEDAHWRYNGLDWTDARAISQGEARDETVSVSFLSRVQSRRGYLVSPTVPSPLLPSIPEYCFARHSDGKLPFHVSVDKGAPVDIIIQLLGPSSHLASHYSDQYGLPIHYVCSVPECRLSAESRCGLVGALIDMHPQGCFVKSPLGDYPLHLVMANNPTIGLVTLFTSLGHEFQPGLSSCLLGSLTDSCGQVPLHLAFIHQVPRDVVVAVAEMNPCMLDHCRDSDQKTPIELSSFGDSDLSFILSIVTVPHTACVSLPIIR